MTITPDDIRAYMSARWKAASCARCGAADWASGEIENVNGLLLLGKPEDTTLGQTRETLPARYSASMQFRQLRRERSIRFA